MKIVFKINYDCFVLEGISSSMRDFIIPVLFLKFLMFCVSKKLSLSNKNLKFTIKILEFELPCHTLSKIVLFSIFIVYFVACLFDYKFH